MKLCCLAVFLSSIISVQCLNITSYQEAAIGQKHEVIIRENEGKFLSFYVPDISNVEEEDYQWSVYVKLIQPSREDFNTQDGSETLGSADIQKSGQETQTRKPQAEVTISDGETANSFKIPYLWFDNDKNVILETHQKRLKICLENKVLRNSSLEILLSTRSRLPMLLAVEVMLVSKWVQPPVVDGQILDQDSLSVSQPVVKYFNTRTIQSSLTTTDYLLLTVHSAPGSECLCSVVSVQQPKCPIVDTLGMVQRFSSWQTMLENTTMLINPAKYPDGFVLVISASPTDDICNVVLETNRCKSLAEGRLSAEVSKNITVIIRQNSEEKDYLLGTLVVATVYLVIFIVSSLMSAHGFTYDYNKYEDLLDMIKEKLMLKQAEETMKLSMFKGAKERGIKRLESMLTEQKCGNSNGTTQTMKEDCDTVESVEIINNDLFLEVDDVDDLGIRMNEKYKGRLKHDLTLADLSKKIDDETQTKSMYDKSDLHWVILIIVSVYYFLPTIQMVLNSNNEYDETGNHDLCFYNNLCMKPLGEMRDFNHLFSNLGYIVFGMLFNCLVYLKGRNFKTLLVPSQNKFDPHLHGIPHQNGLYYAMGCALIMEGIMSSCYHVCPATVTFQFDTTYMYLIAILMFLKLYQGRHPDVSCDAFKSYMGLGIALTLEAFSYYYNGLVFWIVFCIIYFVFIITIGVNTYNLGVVRYDFMILWNVTTMLLREVKKTIVASTGATECKAPVFRARLMVILLMGSFNILLCIYFGFNMADYASNYLLLMFMGNLFLYMNYYIIMKFYTGERMTWSCYIYIVCMLATGFPSLYFFTTIERSSDLSPAESRMLNKPCTLFNFYDFHDIWHFLGGAGVFFTFMFLLNIDEDVKYKRRDRLFVF